jgi:hypothetical protein
MTMKLTPRSQGGQGIAAERGHIAFDQGVRAGFDLLAEPLPALLDRRTGKVDPGPRHTQRAQ